MTDARPDHPTIDRDTPTPGRGPRLRRRTIALIGAAAGAALGLGTAVGAGVSLTAPEFDPATLAGPEGMHSPWYMSRDVFERHIDDTDALCDWAHDQGDEVETAVRPYGGDGLPIVVMDYCGMGTRPEDGSALPAGQSSVWHDYQMDCSRYAHDKLDAPGGWAGLITENAPTVACLNGQSGTTVDEAQWAYPDAVDARLAQLTPPSKVDHEGRPRPDLNDPAVCDWIVNAVGETDKLGARTVQPTDGAVYIQPDHDTIAAALRTSELQVADGIVWNLANLCHPQGNPGLNETAPDGIPDEPHVTAAD